MATQAAVVGSGVAAEDDAAPVAETATAKDEGKAYSRERLCQTREKEKKKGKNQVRTACSQQ